MKERWNYVLYLVWFSYLLISAVLMFGHGFLLSRKTLSDISECVSLSSFGCDGREGLSVDGCSNEEKIRRIISNPGAPMVCLPSNNRVMLIVVDALRYDFIAYDEDVLKPLPYQNRLPVINDILKHHPNKARLYQFMADPPTTTFQRVKALVTGSLPTFIDATSNFAAMELQEDNVVDQVHSSGGRVVLLGDDTWARLMPGKWLRSHALYSFHTWDLDTVDNEVDTKIYDEALKDDWDLLIAHYLGVDHAGHRYGPHHPEMTRKLDETNRRLKRIIDIIPDDVTLYVIGDHGMTDTGDHGGESKSERGAGFFAYRGSGLNADRGDAGREVPQTDFAPTLSAALGRPPPSPSLGHVQLPALPEMSLNDILLYVTNNLKQITQYLVRYGEESQQIPLEILTNLINSTRNQIDRAAIVDTEDDLESYVADVRNLLDEVKGTFREVWVEFDSLLMMRALLMLLLVVFFNWLMTEGIPVERLPNIFASTFVPYSLIANFVCIGFCCALYYLQLTNDLENTIYLGTGLTSGVFLSALTIMHWDGISQRWYEVRSPLYERFARGALVASAAALLSNSYIIEEGASLSFLALSVLALVAWNIGNVRAVAWWVACGVALAVSRQYRGCREEQVVCWAGGAGAGAGQATRAGLVAALGGAAAAAAAARRAAGWRGYGLALAALLGCAHWALGWGALGSPPRSRLLARAAWLALGLMFPLLWRRDSSGAVTPLLSTSLLIYLANALVLGAAYSPAAGLALLAGFCALNLIATQKDGVAKFSMSSRSNSSVSVAWALLAIYMFYGTGHHPTLGHVRWAPAFHAGDPNYLPVGPAVTAFLVGLELFGMPLLFGAATPLLALWGRAAGVSARTQLSTVFLVALKFGLCFAVRAFAICLAATIHCRHLMIWGVFTPKLLFEGGCCAAACAGATLGAALAVWHTPVPHNKTS